MNIIDKSCVYGNNCQFGSFVIIEEDVVIGNNVKIGNRVTLKPGTIIGDNSIIDDHCITTGACIIGNNVNVRTGAIVSKATVIEDYSFIGPGVITNHTKHVTHGRKQKISEEQLVTYIGYGAIIGSQASILAGVIMEPEVIVGGGSVVVKNLASGVYVGSPAKRISAIPQAYKLDLPENAGSQYLSKQSFQHLKKYMPFLINNCLFEL